MNSQNTKNAMRSSERKIPMIAISSSRNHDDVRLDAELDVALGREEAEREQQRR